MKKTFSLLLMVIAIINGFVSFVLGAGSPQGVSLLGLAPSRGHPWSSYPVYAGYRPRPEWLTCSAIWRLAAMPNMRDTTAYRRYSSVGASPGKNALLPGTTAAFPATGGSAGEEPPRLNPRLQSVVPLRRIAAGLVGGSCPSAHRFPLAFLPPAGYPAGVGFK